MIFSIHKTEDDWEETISSYEGFTLSDEPESFPCAVFFGNAFGINDEVKVQQVYFLYPDEAHELVHTLYELEGLA